jgi:LacI family transcriptional regulator
MPNIRDVSARAGVAPSTVSAVFTGKGRVGPTTRARVIAAAQSLSYRPNGLAQSLRRRQTKSIGLIIPSVSNPFYMALARGAEDAAFAAGYDVLLCNSDRDPAKEWHYVASLRDKWIAAMIFAAPMVALDQVVFAKHESTAVVVMNAPYEDQSVDEIWIDYRSATREIVEYLVGLGHRRIAYLGGPQSVPRFRDRLEGYCGTLRALGLYDEGLVRIGGYGFEDGYAQAATLTAARADVTAIFCASDVIAIGALGALVDRGVRVPADVSLVGFDDVPLASLVRPRLTTVYQPSYEAGKVAVELALARLRDGANAPKQRRQLGTRLIVRDSAGPPRPGR